MQTLARRAAELSKCDLLTLMVGEFPELQGLMGKYYAQHDGEPAEVCTALEEQYWPRFAGDRIPQTRTGIALALADKLDTLAGIFAIGQKPTGTRDPFGLRRAALGVLRTILERQLDLDLRQLIETAVAAQPVEKKPEIADEVWTYVVERLRSSYLEGEAGRAVTTEMFDAVLASRTQSVLDMDLRLRALEPFLKMSEAESLAAANKRIANILRKAPDDVTGAVDTSRLQDGPERQLFEHVLSMERAVNPLFARREYAQALTQLATLRDDVDRFFDSVMVMAEDAEVRANRLGLLLRLRGSVPAVRGPVASARLSGGHRVQLLRSVLFTTCLFIGTLLYAVAVVALSWLPNDKLYGVARSWARTHLWLLKTLCGLTHTVEGQREHPARRARLDVEAFVGVGNDRAGRDLSAAILGAETRADVDPAGRLGRARAEADRDRSQSRRCGRVASDRAGNAAAERRDVDPDLPRGHSRRRRRDAQVRRERRPARLARRLQDRAGRAQRRLLLAASWLGEEARSHPRRDRTADRSSGA